MTSTSTPSSLRQALLATACLSGLLALPAPAAHQVHKAGPMRMVSPPEDAVGRLNLHYGGTGRPEVARFRIDVDQVKGLDCNFDTSGVDLPGFMEAVPGFGAWTASIEQAGAARQIGAWLNAEGRIVAYGGEFEPGGGVHIGINVTWDYPHVPSEAGAKEHVRREYPLAFSTFKVWLEFPAEDDRQGFRYEEDGSRHGPDDVELNAPKVALSWGIQKMKVEAGKAQGHVDEEEYKEYRHETQGFVIRAGSADGLTDLVLGQIQTSPYIEIEGRYQISGFATGVKDPGIVGKLAVSLTGVAVPYGKYAAAALEYTMEALQGDANSIAFIGGEAVIQGAAKSERLVVTRSNDEPKAVADLSGLSISAKKHYLLGQSVGMSIHVAAWARAKCTTSLGGAKALVSQPIFGEGEWNDLRGRFGVEEPPVYMSPYVRVIAP